MLMIGPFVYAYQELQVCDTIEENKSIGLERQRAFKKTWDGPYVSVLYIKVKYKKKSLAIHGMPINTRKVYNVPISTP